MPNGLYAAAKSSLVASSIVVGGLLGLRAMRYVNGEAADTRRGLYPEIPVLNSRELEGVPETIDALKAEIEQLRMGRQTLVGILEKRDREKQELEEKIRVEGAEYTAINSDLQRQISTMEAVVQGLEAKLNAHKP